MTSPAAAPVKPLNPQEHPLTWPTRTVDQLSEDARIFYRRALGTNRLDRDYTPSEGELAAISELEAARLLSYGPGFSIGTTRIHPLYTVAHGRGSQLIRVFTTSGQPGLDEFLLAVIVGGDLMHLGSSGPDQAHSLEIVARHENATDIEHDTSSAARLQLMNPSAPAFSGYGRMTLFGLLTRANLYRLGTDPTRQEDQDTSPGTCRSCAEHHPFAPYLPPEIEEITDRPVMVRVHCVPIRPYLVQRD